MNEQLSQTDFFQIENDRPLSNIDVEILTDLYLPYIGSDGLAVYLKLFRYKEDRPRSHSQLFQSLGMSTGQFVSARRKLEGMSLLETRLTHSSKDAAVYLYVLKSPISGKDFLSSDLLRQGLLNATSKDVVGWLDKVYKLTDSKHVKGGENISENFTDVFQIGEGKNIGSALMDFSKAKRNVKTYFNMELLTLLLKKRHPNLSKALFTAVELRKIEDLAALYHYNEEAIADILESVTNFNAAEGERLNLEAFKKELIADQSMNYLKASESDMRKGKIVIPGQSDAAKLMRTLQNLSPEEFLIKKQGGGMLSKSDAALIETLREMNLKDSVINALLEYVLANHEGSLPSSYVTKIAGSLARNGFDNSIDAYNYLNRSNRSATKAVAKPAEEKETAKDSSETKEPEENVLYMFGEE